MKTAISLFLLALFIRLIVIFWWRFDGLYGQDAYAYFNQALAITENLPQGQPPPTDFFWPNGYPLLTAFFMGFLGQTAWAGQLATLLCGAALAPLSYGLNRHLWKNERSVNDEPRNTDDLMAHRAGLFAGLIIAVAGQPILSSVVIMADIPALFWATLATWLVVRVVNFEHGDNAAEKHKRIYHDLRFMFYFFAAGIALALAIISRWLYMLIVPALGAYILFAIIQNHPLDLPASPKASFGFPWLSRNRILWWSPLLAIFGGVAILIPQLWLSFNEPEGLAHNFLLGWSPVHFFQREFENIDGHFIYPLPNAVFYAQPAGHPAYIFPLLGLAGLWGIWRLWQTRRWKPLILLLGWAAPVYLFLAGIPFQNFRFGLTLYLPLLILTGFGLSDLLSRGVQKSKGGEVAERKFSPAPLLPCPPAVLGGVITLSLAGMLAWAYPMLDNFLTAQNQSKLIAQQVEQTLPPEATLITFGLTLTVQHYTELHTLELFYLDENSLKSLTESPGPLYLLLDVESIESQWQDKIPQRNYQWLKEHTTLTEMNTFPPYILFQANPARNKHVSWE